MYRTTMLAAVYLVSVTGCAPSPPKPEQLGRVVYSPSQVPGLDEPYKLPELEKGEGKPNEKAAPVETP